MDFKLGQPVKVSAVVHAAKTWQRGDRGLRRSLVSKPCDCTGIVVGLRTSPEGWTEVGDESVFHPTGYKRLVLVATSLYHVVRVFESDVEPIIGW